MKEPMEPVEVAARKLANCTIIDRSRMCSHVACKRAANFLRHAAANGMFEANAVYQTTGVPCTHLGMIQVANRAWALRKKANEVGA